MSLMLSYFVLSFFRRDVLDEIWDWIEWLPETIPTYSSSRRLTLPEADPETLCTITELAITIWPQRLIVGLADQE